MFASVWVGSQFTPVDWAADALVLVLTIGGCILLGPHLLEVGSLLESFYKKATNAVLNEAQYQSAGEDFAKVVTLVGVDVLMGLVFHVAKAPVNRLVVRVKQGGVGKLPGARAAEVPVEPTLTPGPTRRTGLNRWRQEPNSTYTRNGYTYRTDEQRRIISAEGNLRSDPAPRNQYDQTYVGRGDGRLEGDAGGHLIGSQFRGVGTRENMTAMNHAKVNA